MTNEEAKHIVDVAFGIPQAVRRVGEDRTYHEEEIREAKEMAIKALEQQTSEDAVSRQAVLDIFADNADAVRPYSKTWEEVKALPSVKPQPKTGKWIKDDITERSKSAYKHKCDRCGAYHRAMYDYCPSCGAKMFEPQERSGEE